MRPVNTRSHSKSPFEYKTISPVEKDAAYKNPERETNQRSPENPQSSTLGLNIIHKNFEVQKPKENKHQYTIPDYTQSSSKQIVNQDDIVPKIDEIETAKSYDKNFQSCENGSPEKLAPKNIQKEEIVLMNSNHSELHDNNDNNETIESPLSDEEVPIIDRSKGVIPSHIMKALTKSKDNTQLIQNILNENRRKAQLNKSSIVKDNNITIYKNIQDHPVYKKNIEDFEKRKPFLIDYFCKKKIKLNKKTFELKRRYKMYYDLQNQSHKAYERTRERRKIRKVGRPPKANDEDSEGNNILESYDNTAGYGSKSFSALNDTEKSRTRRGKVRQSSNSLSFDEGANYPGKSGVHGFDKGDVVRSEKELMEVIENLQNMENGNEVPPQHSLNPYIKWPYVAAEIPSMILDRKWREVYSKFENRNCLVRDPVNHYKINCYLRHDDVNNSNFDSAKHSHNIEIMSKNCYSDGWSQIEKTKFIEAYSHHPKQFGIISKFVETKSTEQCVLFYYQFKKKLKFKPLPNNANTYKKRLEWLTTHQSSLLAQTTHASNIVKEYITPIPISTCKSNPSISTDDKEIENTVMPKQPRIRSSSKPSMPISNPLISSSTTCERVFEFRADDDNSFKKNPKSEDTGKLEHQIDNASKVIEKIKVTTSHSKPPTIESVVQNEPIIEEKSKSPENICSTSSLSSLDDFNEENKSSSTKSNGSKKLSKKNSTEIEKGVIPASKPANKPIETNNSSLSIKNLLNSSPDCEETPSQANKNPNSLEMILSQPHDEQNFIDKTREPDFIGSSIFQSNSFDSNLYHGSSKRQESTSDILYSRENIHRQSRSYHLPIIHDDNRSHHPGYRPPYIINNRRTSRSHEFQNHNINNLHRNHTFNQYNQFPQTPNPYFRTPQQDYNFHQNEFFHPQHNYNENNFPNPNFRPQQNWNREQFNHNEFRPVYFNRNLENENIKRQKDNNSRR